MADIPFSFCTADRASAESLISELVCIFENHEAARPDRSNVGIPAGSHAKSDTAAGPSRED